MIWLEDITGKWARDCKCGRIILHSNKGNAYMLDKRQQGCRNCKKHSDETKRKIGIGNMGKVMSVSSRKLLSQKAKLQMSKGNPFYGRKHTEETKDILRKKCTPFLDGAGRSYDAGSKEFFATLNKCGFCFQENYYHEPTGYFADGYDKHRHTWIEFDTKYHRRPNQKKKDLERQHRIIRYFESIDNPLAQFIRYDAVSKKLKIIYRGKHWMKHLYEHN